MKHFLLYAILSLFALVLTNCNTPNGIKQSVNMDADLMSEKIVLESIKKCGGLRNWEKMKLLSFQKDFELLDANGHVEKKFQQVHTYQYSPVHIHIRSIENSDTVITEYINQTYSKSINGKVVDVSQESIAKSINTSTYVIGIPFKLLDNGTILKYDGETTLDNGQIVDVVSAFYDSEKYNNHSSTDHWKYFFDKEDRSVVGNWVQTSDHYSQIKNLTYVKEGGILFNGRRESHRVDKNGKELYLRAQYNYYNYKVSY